MPELPEVEQFRRLLLPLVSSEHPLQVEQAADNPKIQLGPLVRANTDQFFVSAVVRKGKQIVLKLVDGNKKKAGDLLVHMGMTGHIVSPVNDRCQWGHDGKTVEEDYPPRFTYLYFRLTGTKTEVVFADPRKFGKVVFVEDADPLLGELAPDAWLESQDNPDILPNLVGRPTAVKAILLDQKKAVSGVGNWVADEVLYQTQIHPEQGYLTDEQGRAILRTLHTILEQAVDALAQNVPYPKEWLFHYRWTKKKAGSKDHHGKTLTFITAGGRTSAIVASEQRLYKSQGKVEKKKVSPVKKKSTSSKHFPPAVASATSKKNGTSGRRRSPNSRGDS